MSDPNSPVTPEGSVPPPAVPQQPQASPLPPLPDSSVPPPATPLQPQGQPYTAPAPQGQQMVQRQGDGKSLIVLLLGMGGFIVGFIPSIIALIMAKGAREEYHQSSGMVGNLSFIKIGVVLSWIVIGLSLLGFMLGLGFFLLAVLAGAGSGMDTYTY